MTLPKKIKNFAKFAFSMIRISDKSKCTGCTACVTSCPVQCIVMRRDREGFDYPVANPDICIGCGRCDSVCPVINPIEAAKPIAAYAAKVPDYLLHSSSGGVFPYLAADVISKGGVVFGAVMNPDLTVGHSEAETMDEVEAMRGSKYVQSDLYSVFDDVKAYLAEGRKVLFTGTPCQIAGLNSFLGSRSNGLLTVEVACHGVPGPGLWERYLDCLSRKYKGRITEVTFRDKSHGWVHYEFVVANEAGRFARPYMDDPYMALFVQNMTLRPSCYSCTARGGRSGSDITLADMWTVSRLAGQMDDDKGTSLVVANTKAGQEALRELKGIEVPFDAASCGNDGFAGRVEVPQRREEFFAGYLSAKDLHSFMKGFVVRRPFHVRMYRKVRSALSRLKRRISG